MDPLDLRRPGLAALFASQVLQRRGRTGDFERMIFSGWCAVAGSWIMKRHRYTRAGFIGLALIELTGHANTIIARR